MQNPGNKQCCRNSFFSRNVQILQTRSLQDSLRERHFQLYSSKVFVHGQNSSYNRILECASDYASPLHFRHVKDALTTYSTVTTWDRILPTISTGKLSIPPSLTLVSLFLSPHPILRFPVSLVVPILFNTSTKRDF